MAVAPVVCIQPREKKHNSSSNPTHRKFQRSSTPPQVVVWLIQPHPQEVVWFIQPYLQEVVWLIQPRPQEVVWHIQPHPQEVVWLYQPHPQEVVWPIQPHPQEVVWPIQPRPYPYTNSHLTGSQMTYMPPRKFFRMVTFLGASGRGVWFPGGGVGHRAHNQRVLIAGHVAVLPRALHGLMALAICSWPLPPPPSPADQCTDPTTHPGGPALLAGSFPPPLVM